MRRGKILDVVGKGKYWIMDLYVWICERVEMEWYVEDELELVDMGKGENVEKGEEFVSKL